MIFAKNVKAHNKLIIRTGEVEKLTGREPIENFHRSVICNRLNFMDFRIRYQVKIHAFRRHNKLIIRTDEVEKLTGRESIENFHRSVIYNSLNFMDFFVRDQVKIRAFRKKLSQNFVAIFNLSFFPAVIRCTKKAFAI